MGRNLTSLPISASFQYLMQISGSAVTDGTGSLISSLDVTATNATNATNATSASFATTASYALNAEQVNTGSLLTTASISDATITFTKGDASTFDITVNNVSSSISASTATLATLASSSQKVAMVNAGAETITLVGVTGTGTQSIKINSGAVTITGSLINGTASLANNATSASYATTASFALNAPSIDTGSFVKNNTDTYTSTGKVEHVITLTQAEFNAVSASADPNTLYYITDAVSSVTSASYAVSASHADNASTADFATSAGTASLATTATLATSASHAVTASHALISEDLTSGANINISSITASSATFTSASIGYLQTVTGSATIIGDAFILLNNDTPTQRYAGIQVYDSGSPQTSSLTWDGGTDDWFYEFSSSATHEFGVVMMGPEYSTKGSPTYPTANRLLKGNGGHHVEDSSITDDGTLVTITANVSASGYVSASAFIGDLTGNASTATTASYANNASTADSATTATSASYATNASTADSATTATTATSASYASTASYLEGGIDPFPYSGTASIDGGLEVTGSIKSIGGVAIGSETFPTSLTTNGNVVIGGSGNGNPNNGPRITNGTANVVIGGYRTEVSSTSLWNSIFGGSGNLISAGDTNTIAGGYYNTISAGSWGSVFGGKGATLSNAGAKVNVIVGGDTNTISSGDDNVIIGGASNTNTHDRSVVLGGSSISSTKADEVSVPNLTISGSAVGKVQALTITSNTASMDCSTGNFFTLTLASSADTHLDASNIQAGQTINVKITQPATTGSLSFSADFAFPSGSTYTGSAVGSAVDLVSMVSFDTTKLYANQIENLV